jgi:hypothetical protein
VRFSGILTAARARCGRRPGVSLAGCLNIELGGSAPSKENVAQGPPSAPPIPMADAFPTALDALAALPEGRCWPSVPAPDTWHLFSTCARFGLASQVNKLFDGVIFSPARDPPGRLGVMSKFPSYFRRGAGGGKPGTIVNHGWRRSLASQLRGSTTAW